MSRREYESYVGGKDDEELNDIDTPIPEGLPEPWAYRMFIMPVGIKRVTKGGIILADESIDAQKWLNAIGRVARLGPGCYKHPRFAELGMSGSDFPKAGDLVLYSAHAPRRFRFKGVRMIIVNDDMIDGIIEDEDSTSYFSFYV